jgi:hypothetical protein
MRVGINEILTIVVLLAGMAGGYFGGKRSERSSNVSEAAGVVTILQAEVETMKRKLVEKDTQLAEMGGRIRTLEDMITQRADVDGVRVVVERIAEKIGA